jgi:hypothetical protein
MDCRTARLLLDYARPQVGELPAGETDALEAHLAGCPDCDALARAERQADERLGQAMRDVPVPQGLQERILVRLEAERGDRQRRWLGWTVRAAAAAAVIVLAVYAGLTLYPKKPPPLDLWAFHTATVEKYISPDPRKVEAWFQEQHKLTTTAPSSFNYAYLKHYDLAECQGRRVPMLLFIRGDTEAHVFVVTKEQFDLDAVGDGESVDSGGYHVGVLRDDDRDHDHAFVVVYRGESLKPVLLDEQGPAQ